MRRPALAPVLVGLAMTGLLAGIPCQTQAQIVKISVGANQSDVIWQTSPSAFAEVTRWGGFSLALLIESATISAGIALVDFQTMRFKYPPSFYVGAGITIARLAITKISVGGGVVITPARNWIAWYLGTTLVASLTPAIEVTTGMGIETTRGAGGSSPGTCIYFDVGAYWSWSLF